MGCTQNSASTSLFQLILHSGRLPRRFAPRNDMVDGTLLRPFILLPQTIIYRFIFAYSFSNSSRRGLNSTSTMQKLPMQWAMSKGMPEAHLATA